MKVTQPVITQSQLLDEANLNVSVIHTLWYAHYGNPQGVRIVVFHGGPGFGCSPIDMKVNMSSDLHKNWPGSELTVVQDAGHSAMEPGIATALVEATERMKFRQD